MTGRNHAQTTIEFALCAIAFFMLTVGVVDFGRAIWTYNTIASLAREASRYAAVSTPTRTSSNIITYMVGATGRCQAFAVTCTATPDPPANQAGIQVTQRGQCGKPSQPARITIYYTFQPASLMIANLWGGGNLTLQATSQAFVEPASIGGCPE